MKEIARLKSSSSIPAQSMCISYSSFYRASIIYLTLPVLIFFIGYLKPWWSVLFTAGLAFAAFWAMRRCSLDNNGKPSKAAERSINISPKYLAVIIPLLILVLYWGGVAEFGWSTIDHRVRYAILNDLVDYKWPIIYDMASQKNPAVAAQLGDGEAAFAYYFTYWMIPALAGKAFGLIFARIVLFIWAGIGLFLVTIGASILYGRASRSLFVGMMLFAGFDIIPYYINQLMDKTTTWEGWNLHLYIHGNFYQIMNVFNQSIPGWLITILLMMSVNSFSIGLLGGLMFCYSPWATIGIVPLCICKMVMNIKGAQNDEKTGKSLVKGILSPDNLIAPIVCFISFAALYTANSNATGSDGFIWNFYSSKLTLLKEYIWLVVFDFGIWLLLILIFAKDRRKDPMLWTAVASLLVLPVYKISIANDFLMRGSMAPMFLISLYAVMMVTDNFERCRSKDNREIIPRLIVLALLISAFSTANLAFYSAVRSCEIHFTDNKEEDVKYDIGSFGNIAHEDQLEMVRTQFYVYDYEDTIFFKYLAR